MARTVLYEDLESRTHLRLFDGRPGSPSFRGVTPSEARDAIAADVVLAIEGTHASCKTTLTHALAACYRERGIHVATVEEPARHSPFIEEIVVHDKGAFDLETEVDLFAAQLSAQLRAMQGLNSRKGTCRSRDDLLAELSDVIITAAVAMSGIAGDVNQARGHLERRLTVVTERAGL